MSAAPPLASLVASGLLVLIASCAPDTLPDELPEPGAMELPLGAPVLAFDTYEKNGELSPSAMSCLWSKGYRHLIANVREQRYFEQHVRAALAQGMTADAYVYLYFDRYQGLVADALQKVSSNPSVRMLWLDVEGTTNTVGIPAVVSALKDCVARCKAAGVRCGFYTSKTMWARFTGDSHEFASYPLWDADWDKTASLGAMSPYGGWAQREAKQFWGWGWSSLVACDPDLHYADPDFISVVPVGSRDGGAVPDAGGVLDAGADGGADGGAADGGSPAEDAGLEPPASTSPTPTAPPETVRGCGCSAPSDGVRMLPWALAVLGLCRARRARRT